MLLQFVHWLLLRLYDYLGGVKIPLTEEQIITKIKAKLTTMGAAGRPATVRPRPVVLDPKEVAFNAAVKKCLANKTDYRDIVIAVVKKRKW